MARIRIKAALTVLWLIGPLPSVFADPVVLPDTDMAGEDLRHFSEPRPRARLCQDACMIDPTCRAWTYMREGRLGPLAVCWLKHGAPTPNHDDCCTSGTK